MKMDLLNDNKDLKDRLYKAITDDGMFIPQAAEDATLLGCPIGKQQLGRYLRGKFKSNMPHEKIMWLCTRYGVKVELVSRIREIPVLQRKRDAISLWRRFEQIKKKQK